MTKRTKIFLLVGCLVMVITHFRWFNGFGVLTHGDWHVQLSESIRSAFAWPQIWNYYNLGSFNIHLPFSVLHLTHGALASLGLSYGVIERLLYLWPITILSFAGIFLLVRRVTRSDIGAFVGGMVYALNVYFLTIQTQHIYIMLADALAPLAVLAYIEAVERNRARLVVLAGLALFAVSAADFRIFYILGLVLPVYAIGLAIGWRDWRHWRRLVGAGVVALAPFLLALALNAYWLLGFVSTSSLTDNELVNRQLFSGGQADLLAALSLWSGGWTGGAIDWFAANPAPLYFLLWPFAALLGFLLTRRNRHARFFFFMALLGVFLVKQTSPPFGGVYVWLYENFPGFNAFREASKFKFLSVMGYAVLIGFFVRWVWSRWRRNRWQFGARYLVVGLLLALCLLNAKPLVTGEIGALFKPVSPSPDYARLNELIAVDADYYRLLWTPSDIAWGLATQTHPRVSLDSLSQTVLGQSAIEKSNELYPERNIPPQLPLTDLISSSSGDQLLDLLSVRYVVLPTVGETGQLDIFGLYRMDRDEMLGWFGEASFLRPVDLGFTELTVYENEEYRPHLYSTSAPEAIGFFGRDVSPVEYRPVAPTEYQLTLTGIDGPTYLNFNDAFHPNWSLFSGRLSWFGRMFPGEDNRIGVIHEKSWAGTNTFLIDPPKYCAAAHCEINPAGGFDTELTLYFSPQKWVYLGSGLSLAVLLGCLAFLVFDWRWRWPRTENL